MDNHEEYDDGEETYDGKADDRAPSNAGSFDFASYLTSLTGETWLIEDLAGGNANHTARGTQAPSGGGNKRKLVDSLGQRLVEYSSVVLKYAPPFFYRSPEMKFDPYRQTVEARVLTALHDPASPLYRVTQAMNDVSMPVLIDHCASQCVLIESDLGHLPTADRFLMSPSTTLQQATRAGSLLAEYLIELHRSVFFTPKHTSSPVSKLERSLINSYVEPTMIGVISNAENYMKMAKIPDYETLGRRAREHWTNRKMSVFGQGDIWYGTILVDAPPEDDDDLKLGVCDWELAGPTHPAADIAQFGAYLQLSTLSPLVDDRQRSVVHAFSDAFYSSYFGSLDSVVEDLEEFRRSLVIFHGWNVINASSWRQYLWCACKPDNISICGHSLETVRLGACMLRAAGNQEVCWKELESIAWLRYSRCDKLTIYPISPSFHIMVNVVVANWQQGCDAIEVSHGGYNSRHWKWIKLSVTEIGS